MFNKAILVWLVGGSMLAVSAAAQVVALPGSVIAVEDGGIAVEVCCYEPPRVHDLLEIGFKNNDGSRLDIGVWRVTSVATCLIEASPVCDAAYRPALGQAATVFVNTGGVVPLPEPGRVEPVVPATELFGDESEQDRIDAYIGLLRSADPRERQHAAKALYRHYRYEPRAQAVAEVALLEGYQQDPFDAHHVDAMSWLCNILGASGNRAFRQSLETVSDRAQSVKLSRYALRNLYRLG